MNFPVFDLHCDTASRLLGKSNRECGNLRENTYHIDLNRAGKLPGYAQCFACFTTDAFSYGEDTPVQIFEREMETVFREVYRNRDVIAIAYDGDQVTENYKNGIMSAILTIEGTAGIGFDPQLLPDLYQVGFRITTLGWNEQNALTGSHVTGGGLSDLGIEYVRMAQKLGMIVDVSHISDAGFRDIMDITEKPIVATHSNSRGVYDVSRNLTDDMFRAICDTGGVAGINLYTDFLGENATLDTVCDHIFHFLEMDPEGQHISLGGDLDGCESLPAGFAGVEDYPSLSRRLLERGAGERIVENIFWNNAVNLLRK